MAAYPILSMDGGGIRGIMTAIILQRLEKQYPGFLSKIQLFAGTSTGGLLALGLACGMSPAEMRVLYQEFGDIVFTDSTLDDFRDLGRLVGADYSLGPLKLVLTKQFGDRYLDSIPKKVLISSFDLDNEDPSQNKRSWKAKFFHNYPGSDSDGDQKIVDVALRTANAPTYFPIYQGYVDGGVVANNPSVCALAQALNPETGGQKLQDLVMISIGTGYNPRYVASQDGDWGLAQWAPHLIYLVMEGGTNLADYQCRQLLGRRYLRLNVHLPEAIGMDRVDQIPLLEDLATNADLSQAFTWLEAFF
jgi:patatin-like phospholipase/acyl hydrolase